jgi:methionyl-tRNA synthetase
VRSNGQSCSGQRTGPFVESLQVNAALANDIGNLLNRTLGLLAKNCGGTLPTAASSIAADNPLRQLAEQQVARTHRDRGPKQEHGRACRQL